MQWSKTKKLFESFLCENLCGRFEVHAAVYRHAHDQPGRVWFTMDGVELFSAADTKFNVQHAQLYRELKRGLAPIPYSDDFWTMYKSEERRALVNASDVAKDRLFSAGVMNSYHLYEPLMTYAQLSIEEALRSENEIIQAFTMLDRRVGKRRLKKLVMSEQKCHPLVWRLYLLRCDVEGIMVV